MGSRWKIASVFGIVVGAIVWVIGVILTTIPGGGWTVYSNGWLQAERFTVYPYQGVGTVMLIIGVLVAIIGFVVLVKPLIFSKKPRNA
jgi:hypothetical protein